MVYVKQKHSTMKQMAYARKLFGGEGATKKQIALDCGYSPNVANSVSSHIENQQGFHSAMAALAMESNNLAIAAMHEFKARGFKDFSNKDLNGALNAIGNAWSKFNKVQNDEDAQTSKRKTQNKLRTLVLQRVENQTVNNNSAEGGKEEPENKNDDPLDF